MDKESITTLLNSIVIEYRLLKFEEQSDEQYSLSFQCKLSGENYDDKCDTFIRNFSHKTASNWIIQKCVRKCQRFELRKRYLCQHSSKNKVRNKSKGEKRNYNCHASISIKFLIQTAHTLKKSAMLREGLHILIVIDYTHSHKLREAQVYNLLRCNDDVKASFERYFESGMSAVAAKTAHEIGLSETQTDSTMLLEILENAQKNPTEEQVNYLLKKWRKEKYGERNISSAIEMLKKKQTHISEGQLIIKENPTIVIIITPIMKRVFLSRLTNEMVFIDSISLGDQTDTCVTLFYVPTKVGALPVAAALHTSLTEENYLIVFNALKETFEKNSQVTFSPSVIMTDNSTAMRNALKIVFPKSNLLLGIFYVTRDLWRCIWSKVNNIHKTDRILIMNSFRDVMFSETEEEMSDCFQNMCHDKINANLMTHLTDLWQRRKEWGLPFRHTILHNTYNYCEASIGIFKHVVLEKCKAYNICALADFVLKTFETYYKGRLLLFANLRSQTITLEYDKFFEISSNIGEITQVNEKKFNIQSLNKSENCLVDKEIGICTCLIGRGGRFCKHLLEVEKKYGVVYKSSLLSSENDGLEIASLALAEVPLPFSKDTIKPDPDDYTNQHILEEAETKISIEPTNFQMQNDIENYNDSILKINDQFTRMANVLQNNVNTSNTSQLEKFAEVLGSLETSSQIISFMQSTCSAGRKKRNFTEERIEAGPPIKMERQS